MVTETAKASGYILCRTRRAAQPYFIENICTNIYSIEELCYYFYHNLYLIDSSVMNAGLADWIEQELGLESLAAKLRQAIGKFSAAEDVLYPVFKEINYLTYTELKELAARLRRYDAEPPLLREKQKGDALMENGMYVHAIEVYQALFKKSDLNEVREGLSEDIYHNLGCAYSYLFQMEKALDCFKAACECGKSEKAMKTYLTALHSVRTPIEYQSAAASLNADQKILDEIEKDLAEFAKRPENVVYPQHINGMLERLTEEYHRSTGS